MAHGKHYYIVKNVSAGDKATSLNAGYITGSYSGDNYDLLSYSDPYTFDGSESYVHNLPVSDAKVCEKSDIFVDYSLYTLEDSQDRHKCFSRNDREFGISIIDTVEAHFRRSQMTDTHIDLLVHSDYSAGGLEQFYLALLLGNITNAISKCQIQRKWNSF